MNETAGTTSGAAGPPATATLDARKARADAELAAIWSEQRAKAARELAGMGRPHGVGGSGGVGPVVGYSGSYPDAKRTRVKGGVSGSIRAAGDQHLDPWTRDRIGAIAQDLLRTSKTARTIFSRLAACICGKRGIRVQSTTKNKDADRTIETWFNGWASDRRACDSRHLLTLWQMQPVWVRSARRDGDVLLNLLSDGRVQTIEGWRIRTPSGSAAKAAAKNSATEIVDGVELGSMGEPVAYHVAVGGSHGSRSPSGFTRVPAEFTIFYRAGMTWASQTRGEPLLAALTRDLEDLDEFQAATKIAARVATYASLVTYTNNPRATADDLTDSVGPAESGVDGSREREQTLGPASVLHLERGDSLQQFKPEQPTTTYESFCRSMLRQICAESGLPYSLAMMDMSQANYYGNRAEMVIGWLSVGADQTDLIDTVLAPLYRWRMGLAAADGLVGGSDWSMHKWIPTPMPEVDLEAAYKARAIGTVFNFTSHRAACEELGNDQEQLIEDRRAETDAMLKAGVPLPWPTTVIPPGSVLIAENNPGAGNAPDADAEREKEKSKA